MGNEIQDLIKSLVIIGIDIGIGIGIDKPINFVGVGPPKIGPRYEVHGIP